MSLKFQNYNSCGRKEKGDLKVFLASAYFLSSDNIEEYEDFLMVTQRLLDKAPSDSIKIIGADINANVGVRKGEDDGGALGLFGINRVNAKGELLVNWPDQEQLCVTNTFFKHNNYVTHHLTLKNFGNVMLDCVLVSYNGFKRVLDTKLWEDSPENDHVGVTIKFAVSTIKHTSERQVSRSVIDWNEVPSENKATGWEWPRGIF